MKRKAKFYTDDYGIECSELGILPYPGGNMLVGPTSYFRVKREREAEGIKCPKWQTLEKYDG